MIAEAWNKGRKIHFASLMDLCHLKNSELEPRYHKYKGRVVLRGDIVKDDSGSYAVITAEQGSSASQMTAAKVTDVFSRLPGCAGQAADAIPANTQVKNGRCSQDLQMFGYIHRSTSGQNHDPVWKTQSFLSKRTCTVTLWKDYHGKSNLRKFFWNTVGKSYKLGMFFVNRAKGLFLSVHVEDTKLTGKKQNIDPMWKELLKEVDLGEPTSFLDHIWGCTQRECEISKDIVDNYRTMFESRSSAGATEKLPCSEILSISSWSYDMEGDAKKCMATIIQSRDAMHG